MLKPLLSGTIFGLLLTGCALFSEKPASDEALTGGSAGADQRAVAAAADPAKLVDTSETPADATPGASTVEDTVHVVATAKPPESLWVRIRQGYAIAPQGEHQQIAAQLAWYADHQAYLNRVVKRATPYWHYIVEEIESRGMPLEFALLPIVESAFDPFAYSHGRAAGLWQFIPGTGRAYGLSQNWWYDGRRDVAQSTRAALDYLQFLYGMFGDWNLALAAYNCGPGNVSQAIEENERLGLPTDFWHLDLPRETSVYVPKLLALKRLVATPEKYGVNLAPVANEPRVVLVDLDSQIDLALAADLAGIPLRELYVLNPGFNRWATAPKGPYDLLLPKEVQDEFLNALAKVPADSRVQWQRHKIQSGESLLSISKDYATTVDVLKDVNNIRGSMIRAGDYLMVPTASQALASYSLSAKQRLAQLRNIPQDEQKIVHYVASGESFWSISREYDVGVRELADWNGMAPGDLLRAGQKLVVWTDDSYTAGASLAKVGLDMVRTIYYTVRSGDSLARIAQQFGVTVSQLVDWNSIDPDNYLQPGQRLKLLVNVTNVSS
ncbi:MAG TPA: LysM peptidoglycan-binding domain-containing protein [Gammaproteobacteria bacterium]|nr:LysM peptidoglycan-binding domain-containing protein [Gammaproteobacteria bacterium]